MPDRPVGEDAKIYYDFPAANGATISVDVFSPTGSSAHIISTPFGPVTGYRYSFTVPASALAVVGPYQVQLSKEPETLNSPTMSARFYVGHRGGYDLSWWDLRRHAAARQRFVVQGQCTVDDGNQFLDVDLVGGSGNYLNRYLMVHPADSPVENWGVVRRVTSFAGNALILSSPFPTAVSPGTRYCLYAVDPREIDESLSLALREVRGRCRIDRRLSGLTTVAVTDTDIRDAKNVSIPTGVKSISGVYRDDTGEAIPNSQWCLLPNRVLRLQSVATDFKPTDTVSIECQTELPMPVFEDSTLDIPPAAVIARASMELLAAREGGPGTDAEAHLQRRISTHNEYEAELRRVAGRIAPGSMPVIN